MSLSVLVFFWGTFAFVCAATRRAPWLLCPVIAMFSYGYSFEMGFLNFYISLGLASFGIAIFWRGRGWERCLAVALALLAMLAHPLGFAWLVAASAYLALAAAIPRRYQILLVAAAGLVLWAARYYFWHHDIVQARDDPFYFFNGSDQLLLFGPPTIRTRVRRFIEAQFKGGNRSVPQVLIEDRAQLQPCVLIEKGNHVGGHYRLVLEMLIVIPQQ